MYQPARNDSFWGKYNATLTIGWLANTDAAPCTDEKSVVAYLAKYCSKDEKWSEKLSDMAAKLLPTVNDRSPLKSFTHKLMNSFLVERDWSAQEVMQVLMSRDLVSSSREVKNLDLGSNQTQYREIDLDADEITPARTLLEHYCARPEEHAVLSVFVAVTWYNFPRGKFTRRRKFRVVNVFPRYDLNIDYKDYCRTKVMLHHPFRDIDGADLRPMDGDLMESWEDAFAYCQEHYHDHPRDPLATLFPSLDEDTDTETIAVPNDDNESNQGEELLGFRRPDCDGEVVTAGSDLNRRPVDINYEWLQEDAEINIAEIQDTITRLTKESPDTDHLPTTPEEAGDWSIGMYGSKKVW